MILQPTAFTRDALTEQEQYYIEAQYRGRRPVIKKHADAEKDFYRQFCEHKKTFPFTDLSEALNGGGGKVYNDNCHYSAEGARLLAEKVVQLFESTEPRPR